MCWGGAYTKKAGLVLLGARYFLLYQRPSTVGSSWFYPGSWFMVFCSWFLVKKNGGGFLPPKARGPRTMKTAPKPPNQE